MQAVPRLVSLLILLVGASLTSAGQFVIDSYVISNGKATITGPNGTPWTKTYTWSVGGGAGGGGYSQDPYPSPGPETMASWGSVVCSGSIQAKLKWEGTDPAPDKAVVKETAGASWSGGSGACNDGIGDPELTDPDFGNSGSSVGTRYSIVVVGSDGTIILPAVTPSSSASLPQSGDAEGNQAADAGVFYNASAAPLEILLSGGISDGRSRKLLVGQKCVATVSSGDLMPTSYSWSISGGMPFKSYTATDTLGKLYAIGTESGSSYTMYFAAVGTPQVTCAVHLAVPSGSRPAAGFNETLTKQCTAQRPDVNVPSPIKEGMVLAVGSGTATGGLVLSGYSDSDLPADMNAVGIKFKASVTTPSAFTGSGAGSGKWVWAQKTTVNTTEVINGSILEVCALGPGNVHQKTNLLDGKWPYDHTEVGVPAYFAANGSFGIDGDEPGITPFDSSASSVSTGDSFETYVMYLPPGEDIQYVPLWKIGWSWSGSATKSGVWTITPVNPPPTPTSASTSVHPEWTNVIASPTFYPAP